MEILWCHWFHCGFLKTALSVGHKAGEVLLECADPWSHVWWASGQRVAFVELRGRSWDFTPPLPIKKALVIWKYKCVCDIHVSYDTKIWTPLHPSPTDLDVTSTLDTSTSLHQPLPPSGSNSEFFPLCFWGISHMCDFLNHHVIFACFRREKNGVIK